jgi:hypothetical protein
MESWPGKSNKFYNSPSSVAQWLSHPHQDQKIKVRIPPGYLVFMGKHSNAFVYNRLNVHCLCVEKRNNGIGPKIFLCIIK